jgi:hypothetical protein
VHGEQAEELDASIDGFLDWHRAHALPQYAKLATEAAQRLEKGMSPEDLVWGYDSLMAQGRESLRTAATRIAPLLGKLDAGQIEHIEKRLAEENRRFGREYLRGTERARRERRAKRIAGRLEDWVGTLSEVQLERIRQYSEVAPLLAGMRDKDNRRLQAAGLELIRTRAADHMPEFVARWDSGRDPAYAAAIESTRSQLYAMLIDVNHTLTPEQRARAVANLRRYAADFQSLSEKR